MKTYTDIPRFRLNRRGYALFMVMLFGGIGMLALGGALSWVQTNGTLIHRSNQNYRAIAAAEAATEKVLARLCRDYKTSLRAKLPRAGGGGSGEPPDRGPAREPGPQRQGATGADALGHCRREI